MSIEIVIPAHNEQHRIGQTLHAYTELSDPDLVITVALDDCTDGTRDIVAAAAVHDPRIRFTEYPRLGKGGVLAEAMRASTADQVAFVDADCSTPPEEIALLARTLDETAADIAIASRFHPASVLPRPRSLKRKVTSVGFQAAVRRLFGLPFFDTQCGAKVLTRTAAERIMPLVSSRDFVFDVDLLVTARALDLTVAEMPTVWIDRDGSRVDALSDSVRMAASLGRLWLHHRVVPVRMPAKALVESLPAGAGSPATGEMPVIDAGLGTDGAGGVRFPEPLPHPTAGTRAAYAPDTYAHDPRTPDPLAQEASRA
ncbi:glycosyltransferase [Nocardioides bruguierae]|uniref:glycosyltransferase n=1 Tax=Nocardioides bruguierae TaxID=2945102 RepID=UPI00202133F1|nr:glycosyltransferase [Nocardioides bruguierae]MCL8025060.1 glycosyltransferase [Nocardioides bruguierae]